jgi:adenylosuccinate lyase
MRSTVVMSLGVLNTYGSSAMAHKPPPISIKIGRATNAARLPSIILAVLHDISKSAGFA